MMSEEKINSPQKGLTAQCPWLVLAGALLLYGLTLSHWVTMSSLPVVARVTGWDWHPFPLVWRQTQVAPLFFVLTCPFRVLPVALQPVALNAFTAVCAALTLGLLAASVRLLPQDRTLEQRQREGGAYSLLSLPTAWMPVLFAVLMLGLYLPFWRNAIAATGNMLDVLVFAFLIYCLLKFRISQNDNWLSVFAFVYGLGTTNNWALIGYFPFFLIALVWIKGVNFFNGRFLARTAGCGCLGLLLYLLIPAIGSLSAERANFLSLLHMELGAQSFGLFREVPRWFVLVAVAPALVPLGMAGWRWTSFEGELSAVGNALNRLMFRLLHIAFLLLALIMFSDFKFSPSLRLQEQPIAFLTCYYLVALCVGYYSGYVLLVFSKRTTQGWDKRGPVGKSVNLLVVGLLWLLAVAAPARLLYENIPHIKAGLNNTLADYSAETIQDLPANPVIILCDDPVQIYLLEAAYRREGKPNKNILLETSSLTYQEYIAYVVSRYPELKKLTIPPEKLRHVLPGDAVTKYLYGLREKYAIYYLRPSFGYYFEAFYLQPHGLVYELQTYPKNVIEPPPPTAQEIKENQDIWAKLGKRTLAALPSLAPLNADAAWASIYYSVGLDFWGVRLQQAGQLQEAYAQFAEALRVNPENFIARINWEYNKRLQKHDPRPIDTGDLIYKAVNLYGGLMPILKNNGPVDEPDLDLAFGDMMADGHDFRQAAILFGRRLQLLPGDASAELDLAKTFVDWGVPDKAIELIPKLRANPAANRWEIARVEALAYYAKRDPASAEKLLQNALKEDPHDENRLAIMAEFYRATAYTALREKKPDEANRRFNAALGYLNQELQILMAGGNTSTKSYTVSGTLLKKAEVELMLKSFDAGITTLGQILDLEPDNATALLNRAVAEVQLNRFQAAKDDFKELRKILPQQPYVVDYGLASVAAREKDPAEEIRCLRRYLETAPDDLPEYQQVKQRLRKLEMP
jgi:tetratricopeptide (TPR) repeat protein